MSTYSQYSHSGFTSAKADGTDSKTWTASSTIQGNAVRYNWSGGSGWDIAFNTSGNTSNPHAWRDDSNVFPVDFSIDQNTWYTGSTSACPDAETIYLRAANGDVHSFLSPQWQYSSANTSSSGPPPGTLSNNVSFIYQEANVPWVSGQIGANEPTGSYPVTTGGSLVQGYGVTNPLSHTNGTRTQFSFPIAYADYGVWHLHKAYVTSALNTPLATAIVSVASKKKVFTNFW